ncbi:MAG: DUF6650 family protein [Desulfomonilia bacterium]
MKFKEVLSRLTGFSVPIFGVSWNPPQPEVTTARKVLAFLEDRRVLYNPYYLEVEDQCYSSVIEIRKFLTDIIGQLGEDSKLGEHLRGIRAACRAFLDESSPGSRRIHMPHRHGPFDSSFFTSLGELRASIGVHIAAIAVMNGLDIEGDLESILPAEAIEEKG